MNQVILTPSEFGCNYQRIKFQDISLDALSYFLENTWSTYEFKTYFDWLNLPKHEEEDHAGFNESSLVFMDNKVIVQFEFNEIPPDPKSIFVTTIPEMLEILTTWKKILELNPKPDEIIINQDDSGKITFETKIYEKNN